MQFRIAAIVWPPPLVPVFTTNKNLFASLASQALNCSQSPDHWVISRFRGYAARVKMVREAWRHLERKAMLGAPSLHVEGFGV